MLVLAAEDYTGPTPADADGQPNYLTAYQRRCSTATGVAPSVYDVDAMGRQAPDPLGVLAHFDAVIWYTGDDYLTREPGQVPGTGTSRLALDEVVAVRDYLNEGGKVFLGGKHAGQQYFEGYEFRNEGFPQPNEDKHGELVRRGAARGAGRLHRAHQRLLPVLPGRVPARGGRRVVDDDADGSRCPSRSWARRRSPARGRPTAQAATRRPARRRRRSRRRRRCCDTPAYDDFSEVVANWDRLEAGPFTPHTGAQYLFSGADDQAYKRLSTQIDRAGADGGTLTFWTSFDIEQDWDYFFVEAAPAGTDEWTTLPDVNGHTSTDGGAVLPRRHAAGARTCTRGSSTTRRTRARRATRRARPATWNAATGSSGGWQQWKIDLSPYAGQTIDLALVHATDWGTLNLGVWLDDITIDAGADSSTTSFEGADLGVWQSGPALASSPNPVQWPTTPSTQSFQEGAVIGTKDLTFVDGPGFTTQYVTTATRDTLVRRLRAGDAEPRPSRRRSSRRCAEYFGLKPE